MRKLSQDQITSINILITEGKSTREIANKLGCDRTTVGRYRKKMLNQSPNPRPGRPTKLTPRDKRAVTRLILNGGAKTAVEATKKLNQEREDKFSSETVRKALKEQGLRAVKKKKKPRLTPAHRRARLNWALAHSEWTMDDWKKVIWSDETKINRMNSDGIKYAWLADPKNLQSQVVDETLKFGGGSVMVWGCMSWFGVGGMERVVGRMKSEQLIEIFEASLLPTLDQVAAQSGSSSVNDVVFQQDNDSKHKSQRTKDWLSSKNISTMIWPSQSPDLNPIEHLWGVVKRKLGEYQEAPKGMHELWERVGEVWSNIDVETCRSLIRSMESRVQAVLKAKGGHTKY